MPLRLKKSLPFREVCDTALNKVPFSFGDIFFLFIFSLGYRTVR